jgi:glycosyltransferase involved in cell wall biosynthesis
MKILLVATGLGVGGAEAQVAGLAVRFRERKHEVHVTSLVPPAGMERVLNRHGVAWNCLGMQRGFPDPRAVPRFARWCRQYRPDVVHAHMIHANLLARVSRLFARMPVLVCTAHSIYEMASGERRIRERTWRERAYGWTDRFCNLTTSICEAGVERYVAAGACPRAKIRCVPNGIDTRRFSRCEEKRRALRASLASPQAFTWLAVGRFDAAKDYDVLLKAFADLEKRSSPSNLLLAGDGPLLENIKALAKTLHLEDRVAFLGRREDVADLMSAADAFVMSSFYEGLPLVLLEAQACELPVVATRVGGIAEAVEDGATGFLVPARRPELLAEAMDRVMEKPETERRQIGGAGRERVLARFDMDSVVDGWVRLYGEFLGARGRLAPKAGPTAPDLSSRSTGSGD